MLKNLMVSIFFVLTGLVTVSCGFQEKPIPTDDELIESFTKNYESYKYIVETIGTSELPVTTIMLSNNDSLFTIPTIEESNTDDIVKALNNVLARSVRTDALDRAPLSFDSVMFEIYSLGIVTTSGGLSKDILYTTIPPSPDSLVESTDETHELNLKNQTTPASKTYYRKIADNWYISFSYS